MAYTTTTTTSFGQRIKNSFGGIGAGVLMFILGTILLFWNEGRTVKTTRMLKEAESKCVELTDISTVDPAFEGQVVHATGVAATDEILKEDVFGVKANAIKLEREVEYYQIVERTETETTTDGKGRETKTTTYFYEPKWTDEPVDSKKFYYADERDDNFVLKEIEDVTLQAKGVKFGAYRLSESLISQKSDSEALTVEPDPAVIDAYNRSLASALRKDGTKCIHVEGNRIYFGVNPDEPHIGDVRIRYYAVGNGDVSIIAKVVNDTFEKFTAKSGYSLERLTPGTLSSEAMFAAERSSNKATAWGLRIIGILLIFFGLRNIFKFIETTTSIVPILGNIVSFGIGLASLLVTIGWSLIVIAVGWLFYRPVLGIVLLAAGGALIWFLSKKGKEK